MVPELITSIVGSTMRHLLSGVGAALVTHGWISEADWTQLLAGAIMIVAGYVWAVYQKWTAPTPPAI